MGSLKYFLTLEDEDKNLYLFKGINEELIHIGKHEGDNFIPKHHLKEIDKKNKEVGKVAFGGIVHDYQFMYYRVMFSFEKLQVDSLFGEIINNKDLIYPCRAFFCDAGCKLKDNKEDKICRFKLDDAQAYGVVILSVNDNYINSETN